MLSEGIIISVGISVYRSTNGDEDKLLCHKCLSIKKSPSIIMIKALNEHNGSFT